MNITRAIIVALIFLFINIVAGCGAESDQTSDQTPRKFQTSDDHEALRKARRSGNRGDVHRELMKKSKQTNKQTKRGNKQRTFSKRGRTKLDDRL